MVINIYASNAIARVNLQGSPTRRQTEGNFYQNLPGGVKILVQEIKMGL